MKHYYNTFNLHFYPTFVSYLLFSVCPWTHITCKNQKCVQKSSFCDRKDDCGDQSDEPNICSCRNYLQLTNSSKICDGTVNCLDSSDEDPKYCPCQMNSFRCSK